jgi:quinol monooxygenase YgiN
VSELVVVNRFRVEESDVDAFRDDAHGAMAALAVMPGYVAGHVGRNVDEPDLWLLTTTWTNVGSYRRALSSYDVKVGAVPLLSRAIDEPSAYETTHPGGAENVQRPRELG